MLIALSLLLIIVCLGALLFWCRKRKKAFIGIIYFFLAIGFILLFVGLAIYFFILQYCKIKDVIQSYKCQLNNAMYQFNNVICKVSNFIDTAESFTESVKESFGSIKEKIHNIKEDIILVTQNLSLPFHTEDREVQI